MKPIKCRKCNNQITLTQTELNTLASRGDVLVGCPECRNIFVYKKPIVYKRSIKFVIRSLFGIGTPLRDGMQIGSSDCLYIASHHCVQKRTCIPNGPQGYTERIIPKQIKTVEELVAYLKKVDFGKI